MILYATFTIWLHVLNFNKANKKLTPILDDIQYLINYLSCRNYCLTWVSIIEALSSGKYRALYNVFRFKLFLDIQYIKYNIASTGLLATI